MHVLASLAACHRLLRAGLGQRSLTTVSLTTASSQSTKWTHRRLRLDH